MDEKQIDQLSAEFLQTNERLWRRLGVIFRPRELKEYRRAVSVVSKLAVKIAADPTAAKLDQRVRTLMAMLEQAGATSAATSDKDVERYLDSLG